jgi:hypothetical protein
MSKYLSYKNKKEKKKKKKKQQPQMSFLKTGLKEIYVIWIE